MKHYIIAIICFLSLSLSAQRSSYQYAIGNVTDSTARVVVIADSVRMVSAWRGAYLSDHHGDRFIETAYKVINRGNTQVYEFRKLKPNTMYSMTVFYMDTFARDTFYTSKGAQQGQLKWWKDGSITYNGKKHNAKHFQQMMIAPVELKVVERKHEEEEED